MGSVNLAATEWEEAERFFADSLDLARTRRIGLEHEAVTLARLARAQLGKSTVATGLGVRRPEGVAVSGPLIAGARLQGGLGRHLRT